MTTRVLITGISGTGKSTLIDELISRGYKAIDFDTSEWYCKQYVRILKIT